MSTSASTLTGRANDPAPLARAHAPGKLILSGEHSVLYGAPALAMAIAQYTEVWFKPLSPGEGLKTAFENLSSGENYPLKLLSQFKSSLDRKFDQFMRGELPVHKILGRPDDLAVYTLASLLQDHADQPSKVNALVNSSAITGLGAVNHLPAPGQLGSKSQLTIGAGMGSSAAVVAATTVLFETLLDRPKTLDERYERVRFCERLKHGRAGPIDAAAVVRGGLIRVGDVGFDVPEIAPDHGLLAGKGWYWILHGRPQSSTGECVSAVRAAHGKDRPLWDSFAAITQALCDALSTGADPDPALRENQRLLEHIGVVPSPTKALTDRVQTLGGAAKICGAGSVQGPFGGAVLVHLDDGDAMTKLMAEYPDLSWSTLRMATEGAATGPMPTSCQEGANP